MPNEWTKGYTAAELESAQQTFGLQFPPDLIDLLRDRRPVRGYDWRTDHVQIRAMIRWPLEGILFDVENNGFWISDWGNRPELSEDRTEVVTTAVEQAPKLIPLIGHRFVPTEPAEAGNPVFSIYQTDIIYYGADLNSYFDNEFGRWSARSSDAYRPIRFWSDFAEGRYLYAPH